MRRGWGGVGVVGEGGARGRTVHESPCTVVLFECRRSL
jgi:hypothetical protein